MGGYSSASSRKKEYNVVYGNMRGVDLSLDGSDISRTRFAYLENMYRDYEGEGSGIVESIPGYRCIHSSGTAIHGLYHYKDSWGFDKIVVHAGVRLDEFYLKDIDKTLNIRSLSGIKSGKSDAFRAKDSLYVLDGENLFRLSSDSAAKIAEGSDEIYVPTTYVNGTEYEQRNLLTRKFSELTTVKNAMSLAYGNHSLKFVITDTERRECKVTGISGADSTVYIPSRALIGDEYYSVTAIENYAFRANAVIKECIVAEGVRTLGIMAFYNCRELERVILPDTVTDIGNGCFTNCNALSELHFGRGLARVGSSVIAICPSLTTITYAGNELDFTKVENTSVLGDTVIQYNRVISSVSIELKVSSPAVSVERVVLGGTEASFEPVMKDGLCRSVILHLTDRGAAEGKDARLYGTLSSSPDDYRSTYSGFMASSFAAGSNVNSVIRGCTVAETFDGRIFLTGNPTYPGFVFYSSLDNTGENNPLYFGELNYFRDGVGNFNNVALLQTSDSLAVFKAADDGGGSIYYHTPHSTGIDIIPKIYPVSYIHTGICAKGEAISFFDDPVFISECGISSLAKRAINLERSIERRSSRINPKLLSEDLQSASLAVWRGYLAVLTNGAVYLADSRDVSEGVGGVSEYEWYYLSGIGSFRNDEPLYKYAPKAHTGYAVHEDPDTQCKGTVYSTVISGETVYFVRSGAVRYEVYPTEERRGGNFYPAKKLLAVGDRLFFSTSIGDVMVFNNDKRGVPPPDVSSKEGFSLDDYKEAYGRRIHPYYYSFAGHAPRYAVQTKRDNCSMPHLEKSTVRGSLAIKCRAVGSGTLVCEVGTDNGGYREVCTLPNSGLQFSDLDFSSLTLGTDEVYTVPIGEREKGWVEKQLTLYTDSYGSPFGIYTLAYRFTVKGKIKKSR